MMRTGTIHFVKNLRPFGFSYTGPFFDNPLGVLIENEDYKSFIIPLHNIDRIDLD